MINGKKMGLGILSYKAHDTLKKTLASLEQQNVGSFFDDYVIYFNDFCDQDKEIADDFSYRAVGGSNIGFTAQQQLAEHIDADYIVLIQNDCPLIETFSELEKQLTRAVELIEAGQIDLMRLRHQWHVGEGFCDVEKYAGFYNISAVNEAFIAREHGLDEKGLKHSLTKHFKIGVCKGLFTHNRFDDSFRKNHPFYNKKI